jgi:hypothetical protein
MATRLPVEQRLVNAPALVDTSSTCSHCSYGCRGWVVDGSFTGGDRPDDRERSNRAPRSPSDFQQSHALIMLTSGWGVWIKPTKVELSAASLNGQPLRCAVSHFPRPFARHPSPMAASFMRIILLAVAVAVASAQASLRGAVTTPPTPEQPVSGCGGTLRGRVLRPQLFAFCAWVLWYTLLPSSCCFRVLYRPC